MTTQAEVYLTAALPGNDLPAGGVRRRLESVLNAPWKFWRADNGQIYSVFLSIGKHMSAAVQADILASSEQGASPIVIATEYDGVVGLAPHYLRLRPSVITEIAGQPVLLRQPQQQGQPNDPISHDTRVPLELLTSLNRAQHLPDYVVAALNRLRRRNRRLRGRPGNHDEHEQTILVDYAKDILDAMGLRSDRIERTKMIRTLEIGGLGAHRDHFFHSFQNYFIGLQVLEALPGCFTPYLEDTGLLWQVSPHDVWFLVAMWHDVGYALQKADKTADWSMGVGLDETGTNDLKRRFLEGSLVQEGLQRISSLVSRLIDPSQAETAWMMPDIGTTLGQDEQQVREAFRVNVAKSHGAISALQLYKDYKQDIDDMESGARDRLLQTVLLAGASMPFHDFWFRRHFRENLGECQICTRKLPFAALLAFVDSIQDDRRDLEEIGETILILQALDIAQPSSVTAIIDSASLSSADLLNKIIEARDVAAALNQPENSLSFTYPNWAVPVD